MPIPLQHGVARMIFNEIKEVTLFVEYSFIYNRHFLPFGRADLTASASLRPIRGGEPQLHGPMPRIYSKLDS